MPKNKISYDMHLPYFSVETTYLGFIVATPRWSLNFIQFWTCKISCHFLIHFLTLNYGHFLFSVTLCKIKWDKKWHKKKEKKNKKVTLHMLTHGAMQGCKLTSWVVCINDKFCDIRKRNVTIRSEIWTTNIRSLGFWDIKECVTLWKLISWSLVCTNSVFHILRGVG